MHKEVIEPSRPKGKDDIYGGTFNRLDEGSLAKNILAWRDQAVRERQEALEWLFSGDTGVSSKALCAHMVGVANNSNFGNMAPSDEADRGRCVRLLHRFPQWVARLHELAGVNEEWKEQVPLILEALNKGDRE